VYHSFYETQYVANLTREESIETLPGFPIGGPTGLRKSTTVSLTWDKHGNVLHPSGKSDATGRFSIIINPAQFPRLGTSLVLAFIEEKKPLALERADGTPVSFELGQAARIDLGEILVKEGE
jgi:hypothetical protein